MNVDSKYIFGGNLNKIRFLVWTFGQELKVGKETVFSACFDTKNVP